METASSRVQLETASYHLILAWGTGLVQTGLPNEGHTGKKCIITSQNCTTLYIHIHIWLTTRVFKPFSLGSQIVFSVLEMSFAHFLCFVIYPNVFLGINRAFIW